MRSTLERVVAALAGATLLAAALQGGGLVLFLGLLVRSPDASEPDGDPCCPRPDSWGETAGWAAVVLALAAVVGLLGAAAIGLLTRALSGRGVPARRLARWAIWVVLAVSGVTAAVIATSLAGAWLAF